MANTERKLQILQTEIIFKERWTAFCQLWKESDIICDPIYLCTCKPRWCWSVHSFSKRRYCSYGAKVWQIGLQSWAVPLCPSFPVYICSNLGILREQALQLANPLFQRQDNKLEPLPTIKHILTYDTPWAMNEMVNSLWMCESTYMSGVLVVRTHRAHYFVMFQPQSCDQPQICSCLSRESNPGPSACSPTLIPLH